MGQATSKGNEAKSKMKISYAHAEIQMQVVVIWCSDPPICVCGFIDPHSNTIQVYNN